jgi:starvation-inducible DNA-binding protein
MATTATKPKTNARLFPTRNDLPAEKRQQMVELLNQHLADLTDLHNQVKYAHWNVKGKDFYQLHLLFDQLAETLEEHIDTVAERTTALGGTAYGTVRQAASRSRLPEYPEVTDGMDHVQALSERYGMAGANSRSGIDSADDVGDADTADLLTQVSRDLDKHLWFLEAHLQGK